MSDFHCLGPSKIDRFLERRRSIHHAFQEMSLSANLVEVLRRANDFVPSAAGSILLDDPNRKIADRRQNTLTFIAAFGDSAEGLVGRKISARQGIAGHVYVSGKPYYSADVRQDEFFYAGIDEQIQYSTESLVAIPIRIERDVCGVLELINRIGAEDYSARDRDLLTIYAGYISISIQNVLDGRQANEIAKRDNLTGLFNDRYLHIALEEAVTEALASHGHLSILFIDLDYFKRVNDAHGHLAGSQVLREVGMLLRQLTTGSRAIAARYGGDEFVLVLPGFSLDESVQLAEEVRERVVAEAFCAQPGDIQQEALDLRGITCSIGAASLRRHLPEGLADDQIKGALLRLADSAMYVSKETGRNRTSVAGEPVRQRRPSSARYRGTIPEPSSR